MKLKLKLSDKPVVLSDQMVRAVLDGRKTQLRQALKPQPPDGYVFAEWVYMPDLMFARFENHDPPDGMWTKRCPHYGRRLWIREAWLPLDDVHRQKFSEPLGAPLDYGPKFPPTRNGFAYRATTDGDGDKIRKEYGYKWRPAITMPRWASRITLQISNIRMERVQDITEEDARAEGCWIDEATHGPCDDSAIDVYRDLWDKTNGSGSWARNPWVWVYVFQRLSR